MQTAAMTSHAALIGSPRLSATMPRETAPSTATAAHISLAWNVTAFPFRIVMRWREGIPGGVPMGQDDRMQRCSRTADRILDTEG